MTNKNTHFWSLSQVARETGKSKSIISKAIANGELSFIERKGNRFQIDPAEVQRVYGKELLDKEKNVLNKKQERSGTKTKSTDNTLNNNNIIATKNDSNDTEESEYNTKNDKRTFFNKDLEYTIKVLEERITLKEEMLLLKEERINEISIEREEWKKQANTLLISYSKQGHAEKRQPAIIKNDIWAILMFASLFLLLSLIVLKNFAII